MHACLGIQGERNIVVTVFNSDSLHPACFPLKFNSINQCPPKGNVPHGPERALRLAPGGQVGGTLRPQEQLCASWLNKTSTLFFERTVDLRHMVSSQLFILLSSRMHRVKKNKKLFFFILKFASIKLYSSCIFNKCLSNELHRFVVESATISSFTPCRCSVERMHDVTSLRADVVTRADVHGSAHYTRRITNTRKPARNYRGNSIEDGFPSLAPSARDFASQHSRGTSVSSLEAIFRRLALVAVA